MIQFDFNFVIPRIINDLKRNLIINITINENIFYSKSRFKLVKYCNFETPSPNFAAPSASITLSLINLMNKF
jgi:hypothetical protein